MREDFVAAIRALDRVLLSGFYVVPLYYPPAQWVARWTRVDHPRANLAVRLFAGNLVDKRMILDSAYQSTDAERATLDDLFRRAGVRRHDAVALIDPPNRERFTDGAPRKLTYAQADRAISAIAARLRGLGLPTDAVVALQLPNTVESVLALLGVIARRHDRRAVAAALAPARCDGGAARHRRQGDPHLRAPGLSGAGRDRHAGGGRACFRSAMSALSATTLPDGVVAARRRVHGGRPELPAPSARRGDPAAHVAAVTFDVSAAGIVPLARNHRQLIAGGLAATAEAGLDAGRGHPLDHSAGSFAGIALTLVPWLLGGGTLALHHGFDADCFAEQARANRTTPWCCRARRWRRWPRPAFSMWQSR